MGSRVRDFHTSTVHELRYSTIRRIIDGWLANSLGLHAGANRDGRDESRYIGRAGFNRFMEENWRKFVSP